MIELGKVNVLEVMRETTVGLFLADTEEHEVLLPWKYVPGDCPVGSLLDVFIYHDGEERLIATTLEPKITLHAFAYLEVADLAPFGAFMDWGLENDLLVPWQEQGIQLKKGDGAVVFMYIDERTGRLVGSTRVGRFLMNTNLSVAEGDEVEALIYEVTDLGLNVIVNQQHKGLVYSNEVFQDLKIGDTVKAWVSRIREDNKLDILLQQPGYGNIDTESKRLLSLLEAADGFLPFNDKSDPIEIKSTLGMSKKTFKKAAGQLFRNKVITIKDDGIHLNA